MYGADMHDCRSTAAVADLSKARAVLSTRRARDETSAEHEKQGHVCQPQLVNRPLSAATLQLAATGRCAPVPSWLEVESQSSKTASCQQMQLINQTQRQLKAHRGITRLPEK
jgi:hypothetical protein